MKIFVLLLLIVFLFMPSRIETRPAQASSDCFPMPGNVSVIAEHPGRDWFAYATPSRIIVHQCDEGLSTEYEIVGVNHLIFDTQIGLNMLLYFGLNTGQTGQINVLTTEVVFYSPPPTGEGGVHGDTTDPIAIPSTSEGGVHGDTTEPAPPELTYERDRFELDVPLGYESEFYKGLDNPKYFGR